MNEYAPAAIFISQISGVALGMGCVFLGLYLLLKGKKKDNETEIIVTVKWLGKIRTSETGVVLIFLGLAFFSFSIVGLMQTREKEHLAAQKDHVITQKANIAAQLETTEALLLHLTPDIMRSIDFQNYVLGLPEQRKSLFIRKTAEIMRSEYRTNIINNPSKEYGPAIEKLEIMLNFIEKLSKENGHLYYYRGEIHRLRKDMDRFRDNFIAYLSSYDYYENSKEILLPVEDNVEVCYKNGHGFCKERTAWILHLLAVDFYRRAMEAGDRPTKLELIDKARSHLVISKKYRPAGFTYHGQINSTQKLEDDIKEQLANLHNK